MEQRTSIAGKPVNVHGKAAAELDLIAALARASEENELIAALTGWFSGQFSGLPVDFLSVANGHLAPRKDQSLPDVDLAELQTWISTADGTCRAAPSGAGVFMQLGHRDEVLGVLHLPVEDNSQEQHTAVYLGGLALSNLRLLNNLRQASSSADREREISAVFRMLIADLASRRELPETLQQSLKLFNRLVPCSNAAIFQMVDGLLVFKTGIKMNPQGECSAFLPHPSLRQIDAAWLKELPLLLDDLPAAAISQVTAIHDQVRSWMGIPLWVGAERMGLLSVGSRQAGAFNAHDAVLAQAFAGELALVMENALLQDEIGQLAITDGLTGLFNRRHFINLAAGEVVRAQRYNRPLALLKLDVDHFNRVNDRYGRAMGDRVLTRIASLCRDKAREVDILGRLGGDEFAFLLPETGRDGARAFARRLRELIINSPVPGSVGLIRVSVSIGLSVLDPSCLNLDDLMRRCEEALYRVRLSGANGVADFE